MKKTWFIFTLLALLVFQSCAKRGNPDGGPIDEEPPRFVRASPDNFTTNFDAREIRIFFDEYVRLKEAQRQIIISPPMDPQPEITPLGGASRSVRIRILDTLQPNTTYTINFGRSIIDHNEGNPLNFFQYVFSTGSYIDSLSVSGTVSDAYLLQPDPFISVMLYEVDENYTDSVAYSSTPRYVTNTLDSTFFRLNYLKEGTYQMVALRDDNNNYRFDPRTEKIAFLENFITLPTDSIYDLSLFQEVPEFVMARPQQAAQQHLLFGYEGKLDRDSIDIRLLNPAPEGFQSRITKDPAKDTLHYWYRPLIERDTLDFFVEGPNYRDSLLVRRRTMKRDTLQFSFDPSGTVSFNRPVNILPTTPLATVSDSLVSLMINDSIPVPFTLNYAPFENRVVLEFEKSENSSYSFQALPGAFTDFYGLANDTLRSTFRTRSYADVGSISLALQNVERFPIIVQLTNERGEVQRSQVSESAASFSFQYLNPAKYLIRVIYDDNANGIWDTGSFLNKRQPEEIIYYPEIIDVRANWDQTYQFML